MKKTTIILVVALISLCMTQATYAQNMDSVEDSESTLEVEEEDFNTKTHREIGLNFTQFVTQFVPLNVKNVKDGPIGYSFKLYNKRGLAFRFGFGANINPNFENSFINIRLGYERRKPLAGKFYYTRGWDILTIAGSFNLPNRTDKTIAAFGLGPVVGLEYHLTNSLILSTESMLFVGLGSGFDVGLHIDIIPPTALFLHLRF